MKITRRNAVGEVKKQAGPSLGSLDPEVLEAQRRQETDARLAQSLEKSAELAKRQKEVHRLNVLLRQRERELNEANIEVGVAVAKFAQVTVANASEKEREAAWADIEKARQCFARLEAEMITLHNVRDNLGGGPIRRTQGLPGDGLAGFHG
jgi:hypothetical protein